MKKFRNLKFMYFDIHFLTIKDYILENKIIFKESLK